MRVVAENLEKLVTGRGLYRVWELAGRGELTVLVARWIDPSKHAHDPFETEEVSIEEHGDQPSVALRVTISMHISDGNGDYSSHQKQRARAARTCSPGELMNPLCNSTVKFSRNTARFGDRDLFEAGDAKRLTIGSVNSLPDLRSGRPETAKITQRINLRTQQTTRRIHVEGR